MGNYALSRERVNAITNSSKLYTNTKRTIEMMYGGRNTRQFTTSNGTKPETETVSNFYSQGRKVLE